MIFYNVSKRPKDITQTWRPQLRDVVTLVDVSSEINTEVIRALVDASHLSGSTKMVDGRPEDWEPCRICRS